MTLGIDLWLPRAHASVSIPHTYLYANMYATYGEKKNKSLNLKKKIQASLYNCLSIWEAKAGGLLQIQGQFGLHCEFQASQRL